MYLPAAVANQLSICACVAATAVDTPPPIRTNTRMARTRTLIVNFFIRPSPQTIVATNAERIIGAVPRSLLPYVG